MSLMQELNDKALRLGVPLSAHLDSPTDVTSVASTATSTMMIAAK